MPDFDPSHSQAHHRPEGPSPARLKPGIKRRIIEGIGAQTAAILLRIVQQIVLVPILIGGWGETLYAEWLVLFSAASLLSILDGGLQIYFGNALLIARAQDDDAAFRRRFAVALCAYGVILSIAVTVIAIGLGLSPWAGRWTAGMSNGGAALTALGLLAAATLIMIPFGLVTAIYRAYGDYGRGGAISIGAEAVRGLAVCVVAALGGTPPMAAGVFLGFAVMSWIFVVGDQRRRYGPMSFVPAWPTRDELRTAALGSALYLSPTLVSPAVVNVPVLLLGLFNAPASAVVLFAVTRTFTGFVRQVVNQFSHPVGAELSRQHAGGDDSAVQRLFASAGRLISGLAGLMAGFTMVVATPFIALWTHGEVSAEPGLVGVFLLTVVVGAPATVAQQLFQYNNRPGVYAAAYAANGALALALCVPLIQSHGALGAGMAVGIAEVMTIGLFVTRAAVTATAVPLARYLATSFGAAAIGLVLGGGAALGWSRMLPSDSLPGLILFAVLWAATVVVPALFVLMTRGERTWLVGAVRTRLGPGGGP